jgi:hypothetical protein
MKKYFVFLFCLLFAVSFVSCNGSGSPSTSSPTTRPPASNDPKQAIPTDSNKDTINQEASNTSIADATPISKQLTEFDLKVGYGISLEKVEDLNAGEKECTFKVTNENGDVVQIVTVKLDDSGKVVGKIDGVEFECKYWFNSDIDYFVKNGNRISGEQMNFSKLGIIFKLSKQNNGEYELV